MLKKYFNYYSRQFHLIGKYTSVYDSDSNLIPMERDELIKGFESKMSLAAFASLYKDRVDNSKKLVYAHGNLVPEHIYNFYTSMYHHNEVFIDQEDISYYYGKKSDPLVEDISNFKKNDFKKDTYQALSGGQGLRFDDWLETGGDIDKLKDSLGH